MKKIPPFRLVPEPLSKEAVNLPGFRWAAPEVGTRNRLGGEPVPRLDDGHWPCCPDCRELMSFYGQLDSVNDEFCVADVGIICVFLCFDCCQVMATIESS